MAQFKPILLVQFDTICSRGVSFFKQFVFFAKTISNQRSCIFLILYYEIHEIFWIDDQRAGQAEFIYDAISATYEHYSFGRMLFGLHKAKEANKDKQGYHKYDILIYKEELKLAELTGDLTPDLLLKEMVQFKD